MTKKTFTTVSVAEIRMKLFFQSLKNHVSEGLPVLLKNREMHTF